MHLLVLSLSLLFRKFCKDWFLVILYTLSYLLGCLYRCTGRAIALSLASGWQHCQNFLSFLCDRQGADKQAILAFIILPPFILLFELLQGPEEVYSNIVTVRSSLDGSGLHQVTHKMKNLKTGGTKTLVNDTVSAQKVTTKVRAAN